MRNILTAEKTYVFLISALLIVLPLYYGFSTGMLIALLAAAVSSLLFHKPTRRAGLFVPILLFLLMALSVLWSDPIENALRGLERQLALLLIPLAFICMPSITLEARNKILYYYAIGMTLFGLVFTTLAGVTFLETGSAASFFYHELVSPLDLNAIYISVFVSIALLHVLFFRPKTALSILMLVVLTIFLLLLASKSIIVATALTGGIGIIRSFKKATVYKLLGALLVGIVLLAVVPNPVKKRFEREIRVSNIEEVFEKERFNKVYDWTGTTLRLFQARIFTEMLAEDPILFTGYGINNSQSKIETKHREYNLWQGYYNYNFHNQYIQAFADLGVFGLLFLFLLLGVLLRHYFKTRDMLFLSLFLIMLVVFMTGTYLWRQRGLYHFLVLYCLLLKALPPENEQKSNLS
ncbi:MAG: O-antigen ligase family protein [Bacteroidota bacterium]